MLVNREIILAKTETVYGTDAAPVGTDAVLFDKASWSHDSVRMNERPAVRSSLAPLKAVYGGSLKQIKITCEIKGSGTAGTAPEIGPLWRACGLGETIVAVTSVTYKPVSSGKESCTIYYYQDGVVHKLTGCVGEPSFSVDVGGRAMVDFTMTGHSVAPIDAALPTPTYDATTPPPFLSASFTVDSYAAVITKLAFSLGNAIGKPGNASAADGYGTIQITKRGVKGSFDPEYNLIATYDWITKWRTGATGALATGTIGSTAGNRWAISMPAVYYSEMGPGDREGVRTLEVGFGAVESTTDDEVSIVYT